MVQSWMSQPRRVDAYAVVDTVKVTTSASTRQFTLLRQDNHSKCVVFRPCYMDEKKKHCRTDWEWLNNSGEHWNGRFLPSFLVAKHVRPTPSITSEVPQFGRSVAHPSVYLGISLSTDSFLLYSRSLWWYRILLITFNSTQIHVHYAIFILPGSSFYFKQCVSSTSILPSVIIEQ